jgi:hypothetical protein
MESQSAFQVEFDFGTSKPVVVEPSAAQLSSDAGLLPFRQLDEQLGLTEGLAACLNDRRDPESISHTLLEMVRMRAYGILADYADQNDHDTLRSDPVFKLLCDRSIHDDDLASQPTLSRFENAIDTGSLLKLRDWLIERFIASFDAPPARLTFDIDPFDDPTHGQQQLTFFHGYYGQYQYLPRVITCAENDLVVDLCLLHGSAHAALAADDDLQYVIGRLRAVWPDVQIHVRGDSGFGVPRVYQACEGLPVDYTIGIGMNARLQRFSQETLQNAVQQYEETGQPQRLFCALEYQADSWDQPRWVIVKCEANAQGTNRRAVVTNRPGSRVLPGAAYDEYADRGESENRNKELKCGLRSDRLSDHRYFANLFRLYLHALSYNLLVRMRHVVEESPLACAKEDAQREELPDEALAGRARRQCHNRRRERDPLGQGQPCTWRTRLIKVAAIVWESTRRVVVQLSSSWPYLEHYQHVSQRVLARGAAASDTS